MSRSTPTTPGRGPTEPRDQEHDMTILNDLRAVDRHHQHMALLTAIHDAIAAEPDPDVVAFEETVVERLTEIRDALAGKTDDFLADAPRVPGLDDPEPVDVTEEPPCGSQVTDKEGDVWERCEMGWTAFVDSEWSSASGDSPWDTVRLYAPLRPTTDADRERVGLPTLHRLEDVAEEFGVDLDAPDVDPDEALAKVIFGEGFSSHEGLRLAQLDVARAAREHIEGEQGNPDTWNQVIDHANRRAEKAEADVERLTRERDEQTRDAIESSGRYKALRADVAAHAGMGYYVSAGNACKAILDRDDERGRDA